MGRSDVFFDKNLCFRSDFILEGIWNLLRLRFCPYIVFL